MVIKVSKKRILIIGASVAGLSAALGRSFDVAEEEKHTLQLFSHDVESVSFAERGRGKGDRIRRRQQWSRK